MKHAFTSTLLTALLALGTQAQAAKLQNGDFALGLNGWQVAGDASVQTGSVLGVSLGSAPALILGTASVDFDDDTPDAPGAFNVSGQAALETGQTAGLEASLGLPTLELGTNGFEGSGAMQTFSVNAGDIISFDWRVLARDYEFMSTESDSAQYFVQTGSNLQTFTLGDLASLPLQNLGNGWLDSGVQHVSFTSTYTGQMSLGFAVVDVNSFNGTSLLAVQNVLAVPEPEGVALALVGLLLLGRASRRLHQH